MRIVASDLQYPQGLINRQDGSVLIAEAGAGVLTRAWGDGRKETVTRFPSAPGGIAEGPDGAIYVSVSDSLLSSRHSSAQGGASGLGAASSAAIMRVDAEAGTCDLLYDKIGDEPLRGPRDICFDTSGGFYFAESGRVRRRDMDRGKICYGAADGSMSKEISGVIITPAGVALSPTGSTLYASEKESGRIYRWPIGSPGVIEPLADHTKAPPHGGELVYAPMQYADGGSLAVTDAGSVCMGTLYQGGIVTLEPQTAEWEFFRIETDTDITGICFGRTGRGKLLVCCARVGVVLEIDWPSRSQRLAHV